MVLRRKGSLGCPFTIFKQKKGNVTSTLPETEGRMMLGIILLLKFIR